MTEPLVDVTGVRRTRARERLRRRMRLVGVLVGVLAVLAATVWVIWGSPWLVAQQVRVRGAELVTPDEVTQVAAVPLGQPLATIDTDAIARRVADGLPQVARAAVDRAWPGAVEITVTERRPVLAVRAGGQYRWVAADGVAFHATSEAPAGVLLGSGTLSDGAVVASLASVAGALPPDVREATRSISARTVDSVTLDLTDGRRVAWGSAEDNELKARVLTPLLTVKAREYDVSAPTHPTTR